MISISEQVYLQKNHVVLHQNYKYSVSFLFDSSLQIYGSGMGVAIVCFQSRAFG